MKKTIIFSFTVLALVFLLAQPNTSQAGPGELRLQSESVGIILDINIGEQTGTIRYTAPDDREPGTYRFVITIRGLYAQPGDVATGTFDPRTEVFTVTHLE